MKLRIKKLKLRTGWPLIALMNVKDAHNCGFHSYSRLKLKVGKRHCIAMLDITSNSNLVRPGEIGLFQEVTDELGLSNEKYIFVEPEPLPKSLSYIKKKMNGRHLNEEEIFTIIKDISEKKLSEVEMTFFVTASYINKFNPKETYYLTKAMVRTGDVLKLRKRKILDKHCIGGIPGNRTTMVIVPIIAANGLTMPKTSSRAITSPSGTADTMEVLANVNHDIESIKRIVGKTNACIVWGGAVNLAPSDDQIIKIERTISIDAESQLLASVMAKKASVSATHLLIDIPYGKNAKCRTKKEAMKLAHKFQALGKKFNIKTNVLLSNGSKPIGNGIGPALEAIDVMKVLNNTDDAPNDLKAKGVYMAGLLLEMAGKTRNGLKLAFETLKSGKALKKMNEIIDAQGRKVKSYKDIKLGSYVYDVPADRNGKIREINNIVISRIARTAGAPADKGAGIYLFKHVGDKVKKGDKLFRVFCESKERLKLVKDLIKEDNGFHW